MWSARLAGTDRMTGRPATSSPHVHSNRFCLIPHHLELSCCTAEYQANAWERCRTCLIPGNTLPGGYARSQAVAWDLSRSTMPGGPLISRLQLLQPISYVHDAAQNARTIATAASHESTSPMHRSLPAVLAICTAVCQVDSSPHCKTL